jgi:tRNA A37 threonylcarbamoyladenosine synthetase subunit TsaC/SUA5/YrdC
MSGEEPIYSSDKLEQFSGNVDVILDAGDLPHRLPSTVVMVQDKKVRILREGAIPKSKIKAALEVK